MRYFLTVSATLVALGVPGLVQAQTLRDTSGPAEMPPASYTGGQYVDSKGCVFIRAGVGGNVTWVPRVNRDRTVVCGQKPTTVVTPQTVAAPSKVEALPTPTSKPVVVTAPAPQRVVVPTRVAPPAPMPQVAADYSINQCKTREGARCGPQDWHPSQSWTVRSGQAVAAPTRKTVVAPRSLTHGTTDTAKYRATWDDGRLNPLRGLRPSSATVPVPSISTRSAVAVAQPAVRARVASNTPVSGRYVQVGSFGVAQNAQATAGRLQAAGLPATLTKSGRYTVVVVGPFAANSGLTMALNTVRRNGFSDAFTR